MTAEGAREAAGSIDPSSTTARQQSRARSGHAHLWQSPDGTGLHAPYAQVVVNVSTGELCCHLCGRWFRFLGAHVRVHGYTADEYREAMGLMRSRALTATDLSKEISRRQTRRYRDSANVRATLAVGHQLARASHDTQPAPRGRTAGYVSPERLAARQIELDQGRNTIAARREAQLEHQLASFGITDLSEYLRGAHRAGISLQVMRQVTGLGRERLKQALHDIGVDQRPAGWNSPKGRRARAVTANATAARRVGTADLHAWLHEKQAEGWSLTRLGEAVGHSSHWVRTRLDRAPDQ